MGRCKPNQTGSEMVGSQKSFLLFPKSILLLVDNVISHSALQSFTARTEYILIDQSLSLWRSAEGTTFDWQVEHRRGLTACPFFYFYISCPSEAPMVSLSCPARSDKSVPYDRQPKKKRVVVWMWICVSLVTLFILHKQLMISVSLQYKWDVHSSRILPRLWCSQMHLVRCSQAITITGYKEFALLAVQEG
jgi:hypothetical protein